MVEKNILERLGNREILPDDLAEVVKKNMDLLPKSIKGVSSPNKRIKNGTAKILRTISEDYPERLYPKFDFFVKHMNGNDSILKWLAMDTIANLAPIDKKNRIDKILSTYYELLLNESIVTAAHAVESLGKIAKAKPKHQDEITRQLFRVKKIDRGSECRNILLGKVILAFDGYMDQVQDKKEIISFVKRELNNSRNATSVKAEKFLKKFRKM
jgi:hypothetical protein